LSYKAAWDAVDSMNNLFDEPLVTRSSGGRHGGGTALTEHGRKVMALYRAVEAEQQAALDRLAAAWGQVDGGSVRACRQLLRRMGMRTSARNQLACTVVGLREGPVNFEVALRLDGHNELVAVITRDAAADLGLALGMDVVAIVKSSSVMLMSAPGLKVSARNQLWGEVVRIVEGGVNSEVTLALSGGKTVTSVVTRDSVRQMGLQEGAKACALFKSSSVILSVLG
jgi:molybdate transport system regulatory protein